MLGLVESLQGRSSDTWCTIWTAQEYAFDYVDSRVQEVSLVDANADEPDFGHHQVVVGCRGAALASVVSDVENIDTMLRVHQFQIDKGLGHPRLDIYLTRLMTGASLGTRAEITIKNILEVTVGDVQGDRSVVLISNGNGAGISIHNPVRRDY